MESEWWGKPRHFSLHWGMWLWLKIGLFPLFVAALLWDGASLTGGIRALPLWYFGAALLTAFTASLGLQLVERAPPQRQRWRQLLLKWGGFVLVLMLINVPHKVSKLDEYAGLEFVRRFVTFLFIPTLILLVLIGVAVLMDGTRE